MSRGAAIPWQVMLRRGLPVSAVAGEGGIPVAFGTLLRRLRIEAGLTQEELAESAGISSRSVSDLERGINLTARRDTARLLADALGLTGGARAEFEASARGRVAGTSPGGVAGASRTLPRDIASFTGREPELRALVESAAGSGGVVGIHAIGGMAGIGKTALAVHAAHALAPRFPTGQIFLPLHGHTPGQRPVDPADALASLLLTAGVPAAQIPPGLEARMALWRDRLAGKQLLLLLDDAADSEQVRPLLPGSAGCLVLVTSRRHLTALEDARTISLDTLPPGDAARLLVRLAGRPNLTSTDAAITEIIVLCGYLPLAVGMLARQLHHHPTWAPADLAAELAAARDRLELMTAENLSVAAAFDLSYQDLTGAQQQMFCRLGLHPGTEIDVYAAAALDDTGLDAARRHLEALYDHYLLAEPVRGRYRLHDLIHEHARALAADQPARDEAVDRLLDYYLHTARAADRHLPRRTPVATPAMTRSPPAHAPELADREAVLAWLDREQVNLHYAAEYASGHDRPGIAIALPRAMHGFLRGQGRWEQARMLHHAALAAARRTGDLLGEAGALTDLGDLQRLVGDYPAAITSLTAAREIYHSTGNKLGEAGALTELSVAHRLTGQYPAAIASLTVALALYRDAASQLGEIVALTELGITQEATGEYRASAASQEQALALCQELGDRPRMATVLHYLGVVQQSLGDYRAAIASQRRAIELNLDVGNRFGEAGARTYLGAALRLAGDYPAARASLTKALEMCRDFPNRLGTANTLNYLGLVQLATGDHNEAAASEEEALHLYRELGDRLGEAEVLNNIGELSLASGTPADARAWHEQGLAIATDIASLPEEARALEGIGRSQLKDGQPGLAASALRRALAIYERIGSPNSTRITATLRILDKS
jgi:tetratricopeptide (TPR) repeat protein/transcriptional regulator with XRE-family HTH domain